MPTVTTQTNSTLPKAHESSALRSPRDSDDVHRQWKRANTSTAQQASDMLAIQNLTRQVEKLRRRMLGAPVAPFQKWQQPYKELDTDLAVDKGTWVYISPDNPIVTTGMTDPIAGAGTKAYPGIWEAAQDVPASSGVDDYNVPQTDYPGATGTPTGTTPYYKGDLDGEDVYWILICPTCGL